MHQGTTYLKMQLVIVLLPVVCSVYTGGAVRGVEADTLGAVETPAANVELTGSLIGQDDGTRAEDVRLDVHRPPREVEVVGQGQVQLVRAGGVLEFTCSEFFQERDLVVDSEGDQKRYNDTTNLRHMTQC